MKILLVEDDEPTAQALKEALSAHHYIVTIATDGQTGLELAQAFTYEPNGSKASRLPGIYR
jgi:DNA-binding response OmpR family regulator